MLKTNREAELDKYLKVFLFLRPTNVTAGDHGPNQAAILNFCPSSDVLPEFR